MSKFKLEDFKVGDQITFKHFHPDHDERQIKWKAQTTKIIRICKSPMPDHIPHKLMVKLWDGEYGIRFDEVLDHEPVLEGQMELFKD